MFLLHERRIFVIAIKDAFMTSPKSLKQEGVFSLNLNPKSIRRLGESFLRDEYDGLARFFHNIWKKPHTYVVLFARRCLNLNEIFMQAYASECDMDCNREQIISNSALLLYSDEIADYYHEWGRFPSILIVDDMIYHGRGIVKLLHNLEELVLARVEEIRRCELTKDERYYVHRDLASTIDIYAYCVNQQSLLIDDVNLRHLDAETKRYTSELRKLSQQISKFLQAVDEPNTSYVLSSAQYLDFGLQSKNWLKQSWSYRGSQQDMFFCVSSLHYASTGFLPSVRIHKKYGDFTSPEVKLTALVILGNVTTEKISKICRDIINVLQNYDLNRFQTVSRILKSENILHQKARMQFLSFLLSVICLRHFYCDMGLAKTGPEIKSIDLNKVACNFARRNDIYFELFELYGQLNLWQDLELLLYRAFSDSAEPFLSRLPKYWETNQNFLTDNINSEVELLFSNIGMKSEESAWHTVNSLKRFRLEMLGEDLIPLDQYIAEISHRKSTTDISEISAISCMLAQMDNGLMSMNIEAAPLYFESNFSKLCCVLKAGELATFVMPRYYHQFIPALALVERECWRLVTDRKNAVEQFIHELPEKFPSPTEQSEDVTEALAVEANAYANLKKNGSAFVSRLYACGQSLNGWNIDLVTMDDWSGQGSYLSFVTFEKMRQKVYYNLAEAFLSKHEKQNKKLD